MNELNKNLLESFSWTINNGQPPNYKYIEVIQSNGITSTDLVSRYNFDILKNGSDIIKYREISMRDYLFGKKEYCQYSGSTNR